MVRVSARIPAWMVEAIEEMAIENPDPLNGDGTSSAFRRILFDGLLLQHPEFVPKKYGGQKP